MFFRRLALALAACALAAPLSALEPALSAYAQVDVPPMKTNAYVASVTMEIGSFIWENGVYRSTYSATVFPYFFMDETGKIEVYVSEQALRRFEKGEPISFTGRAIRSDGKERLIDGKATRLDARSGKLKVRVPVARGLALVFNTPYTLPGGPPGPPAHQ